MCFLLASTIPFFVALLFCRLCKFTESLEIFFNLYRILLLKTCARFLSFLPCIFIVIASFYRFGLVLSFQSRFISIYVLTFSPFLFHLESFVRGVVANCPLIDFTSQKQTDWRLCRITMEVINSYTPQHANQTEKGHVHAKLNRHVNRQKREPTARNYAVTSQ